MKIALGADHAGFAMKGEIARTLCLMGHQVIDVGTSSHEAVDYPIYANAVACLVATRVAELGVVIDGAGIGSAIAANKVDGVRAALAYDISSARNAREHNDANVITLGASLIGPALARDIVATWLSAGCREERHRRRVRLIAEIERGTLPLPEEAEKLLTEAAPSAQVCGRSAVRDAIRSAENLDLSDSDLDRIAQSLATILKSDQSTIPSASELLATTSAGGRPPTTSGSARPTPTSPAVQVARVHVPAAERDGPSVARNPEIARRYLDFGVARLSAAPPAVGIPEDIARRIDHTLLKADATPDQIRRLCAEARSNGFATVCVNPVWVALAAHELRGSDTVVCSVVGFPLGATPSQVKALEARRAIRDGAREIDMVIQIGALKGGDDDFVLEDIRAVVEACRERGAICKVIIEAALLTDDEKRRACRLARRARAHFVKTSTGFGPGGATAHDVALMAEEVRGAGLEVKAAGGIRSFADAKRMLEAGATRIGASASLAIIEEARMAAATEPVAAHALEPAAQASGRLASRAEAE